ncbi:peptidylprolyl isomerase [uncultured Porphyromonas sp.]|uniref:peptidylprolyl isomerase n=1 Tax=uncultured Porphyromonas sp. TaxID=159274 RepID=UPI0026121D66|nr:peptidylprolyl isomerase [uncultured Porphyromonas sp.]
MKAHITTLLLLLALCIPTLTAQTATDTLPAGRRVLVMTSQGDFTLLLYDDTPLHQAAFLEHVRRGDYEGVLMHRVIAQFMIQGGNLLTRFATRETDVSIDTLSTTIPAEILPQHIHKRGALAAARLPDEENPKKDSSGSQFYIVTGTYYTDFDLDDIAAQREWDYTPEQREIYKLQGGTPWLDRQYTVFGEVIDGMRTITKIEDLPTDGTNRPKRDVIIKLMTLLP